MGRLEEPSASNFQETGRSGARSRSNDFATHTQPRRFTTTGLFACLRISHYSRRVTESSRPGPVMGRNGRSRKRSCHVSLIVLLVLTGAFAQSAIDQFPPIASALQDQQFEKALELLRPALQQSPRDARLWTMQGRAYSGLGRKKDALKSFRTALEF